MASRWHFVLGLSAICPAVWRSLLWVMTGDVVEVVSFGVESGEFRVKSYGSAEVKAPPVSGR